jgi:uncharacterized protein YuzE
MRFKFYPDADALYIELDESPYHHSQELDEDRVVHYAEDGHVIGVKFLGVSDGVFLADVPSAHEIGEALARYQHVKIYA